MRYGGLYAALCGAVLACSTDGPNPGPDEISVNLAVETATTGEAQDQDGYVVTVADNPQSPAYFNEAIGVNDTIIFGVYMGTYSVELEDVADNCVVEAGTSRVVEITDPIVEYPVPFEVHCTLDPPAGS